MRLLYVAIFLGAVSCITEFVLKFVKVRGARAHALTTFFVLHGWLRLACHAGSLPVFHGAECRHK